MGSPTITALGPKLLEFAAGNDRAKWTRWLEEAVLEVFELMVHCSLTRRDAKAGGEVFDLCSMVGMAGDICGVLSLRCSRSCGRLIAVTLMKTAICGRGSNVLDAFGEVCNTIAGNFKGKISGYSDDCFLSVPTVIDGWNYSVYLPGESDRLVVSVEFAGEPLCITLDLYSPPLF